MKIIFILLLILILAFLLFCQYRTYTTQHNPLQQAFLKGTVPNPAPDGLYAGSVGKIKTSWKGKTFAKDTNTGINILDEKGSVVQKFPFKTYVAAGLRDTQVQVLKIDYYIPENPLWLRFILDEIVQTEENKFLGKLHLRLFPGISFSLGYFHLERD